VVGDVTPAKVEGLATKYFGNWQRGNYVSNIPTEPAQTDIRYAHVQKAGFLRT
jgi:zinc protease